MSTIMDENLERVKSQYLYEVLDGKDKDIIHQTAEVLADTFLGVQVGNAYVSEPMMTVAKVPKEAFKNFMVEYLEQIAPQGLTVIARDKETGKVVGSVVSEYYDPEASTIVLEGDMEAMNIVNQTTDNLIARYIDVLKSNGKVIEKEKFVHLFLVGIRLERDKKYVAYHLVKLLEEIAKEKNCEQIFAYASNFRSQGLFTKLLGYKIPVDNDGNPIVHPYATDSFFKDIPEHIAVEGQIVYKSLK
jgi:hypothetical protein